MPNPYATPPAFPKLRQPKKRGSSSGLVVLLVAVLAVPTFYLLLRNRDEPPPPEPTDLGAITRVHPSTSAQWVAVEGPGRSTGPSRNGRQNDALAFLLSVTPKDQWIAIGPTVPGWAEPAFSRDGSLFVWLQEAADERKSIEYQAVVRTLGRPPSDRVIEWPAPPLVWSLSPTGRWLAAVQPPFLWRLDLSREGSSPRSASLFPTLPSTAVLTSLPIVLDAHFVWTSDSTAHLFLFRRQRKTGALDLAVLDMDEAGPLKLIHRHSGLDGKGSRLCPDGSLVDWHADQLTHTTLAGELLAQITSTGSITSATCSWERLTLAERTASGHALKIYDGRGRPVGEIDVGDSIPHLATEVRPGLLLVSLESPMRASHWQHILVHLETGTAATAAALLERMGADPDDLFPVSLGSWVVPEPGSLATQLFQDSSSSLLRLDFEKGRAEAILKISE